MNPQAVQVHALASGSPTMVAQAITHCEQMAQSAMVLATAMHRCHTRSAQAIVRDYARTIIAIRTVLA